MDTTTTWNLIHRQHAQLADAQPALYAGWTVQVTAGHIVVGAEQTPPTVPRTPGVALAPAAAVRTLRRDE